MKLSFICFSAVDGFAWFEVSTVDDENDCDDVDDINPRLLDWAIEGLELVLLKVIV